MQQQYENYTLADLLVWKTLFERQYDNLQDKASQTYLDALDRMKTALHADAIPRFEELDGILTKQTGWSIEVVPGIIPVVAFFELLSRRRFCSSTWLRTPAQLDYLEEPDMFHDIFGHVPLLMYDRYADFMQEVGRLGYACRDMPILLDAMERVYWYSIEFGLVSADTDFKIYGAGTLSSFGETNAIFHPDTDIRPFDLDEIMSMSFIKSELQTKYYVIDSMDTLFDSLTYIEWKLKQAESQRV